MTTKEYAIQNLEYLNNVCKERNIDFCLMDGTLLGAYRDKDFCENDEDDIDIGIADKDYDEIIEPLIKGLIEYGFDKFKDFEHNGRLEGVGMRRGPCHLDIIRINKHPERDECYNLGRYHAGVMAFVYPAKHHESFETIEFQGMQFKAPHDIEGFLTARYGNWNKKINRPDFDWFRQANNDCIRTDYDQI